MPNLSLAKRFPWIIYGIVISLLLGGIGFAGTFESAQFQWYYFLGQLGALGIGILHVWLSPRFVPTVFATFGIGLLVTILMLLVGMGVTLVLYQQTGYLGSRWPFVTSLLPFVIPFLVLQAYYYFLHIPLANYRKWYYPVNGDMPDLDLLDLSKILVIQFEFLKTLDDSNFTNFKAKAPVSMPLGDLFLVFINDYNERTPASPIRYTDATGRPYGWVFTKKGSWWKRPVYLDPALDFNQNQLTDNATIIAVRAE
ncbi:TssN family type VI secretion system protein [Spirosoma sp. KNUC1025]|uniref:TssN family type VI secretion system protein n=1 Tax=Spirosoma sp. KNUC1025 TaxID=2894082 RepID=UPI00386C7BEE|nr:TssN family type VI secretion system protein [Spirosoma sp. KNUC1025]